MFQILNFIATGIRIAPELDVILILNVPIEESDAGATATLKINSLLAVWRGFGNA
jgi:hypothetical protein